MSKHVLNELPELVNAGVIDAAASDRIVQYYRQKERAAPDGRINFVFAIIGTILVSLGIILMVAHNWDELSRPVKLFFSFLPLLTGQALCGYTLYKKSGQRGWQESSATFLFFAVGASLELVSQTYHIPGTVKQLLFTWMLIAFPLIYIMRSSLVSLLFIAGVTVYAISDGYGYRGGGSLHYWWMILLVLPHYFTLLKTTAQSNFTYFHHWFIPLSLTICLGTLASNAEALLLMAYMNLFGAFYLIGNADLFYNRRIFSNGYIVFGSLGTMILLLITSFRSLWSSIIYDNEWKDWKINSPEAIAAIILGLLALGLLIIHIRNRKDRPVNLLACIFLAFTLVFFSAMADTLSAAIAINILLLAAAIFIIDRGHRLNHLGILNYGLLIITALVICRFFDTNISFVVRGLMFIAVGTGFFIANNRLIKKRKQHEK